MDTIGVKFILLPAIIIKVVGALNLILDLKMKTSDYQLLKNIAMAGSLLSLLNYNVVKFPLMPLKLN